MTYAVAPLVGWVAAGSLKFLINSLRAGHLAWGKIGYGGMPSTHTGVVSTPAALIALREGLGSPAFSVACALMVIVVLDATGLRRHVGAHAGRLNALESVGGGGEKLRELMGHRWSEVGAGILVGGGCALLLQGLT